MKNLTAFRGYPNLCRIKFTKPKLDEANNLLFGTVQLEAVDTEEINVGDQFNHPDGLITISSIVESRPARGSHLGSATWFKLTGDYTKPKTN